MVNSEHQYHEVSGKNLGWSIILNAGISIAELIGGIISGSMSLLSDATHNFSDVISLVVSYIANKLTKRKATQNQTFGFKRSEIMYGKSMNMTLCLRLMLT